MARHSIVLINTTLDIGGEQLSTMALARGLLERGHEVTWWAAGGPLLKELQRHGIPYAAAPPEGRGLSAGAYVIKAAASLRRLIQTRSIDIVHSQTVVPVLSARLAVRGLRPRPRIIFHERGIHPRTYRLIGRPFNYLADFVIANSHYERSKLIRGGLREDHCRTIHNCMYEDLRWTSDDRTAARRELGLAEHEPAVGVVGRLSVEKGHRYFLEAAARLRERVPHARLVIVGGGPLEDELRQHSRLLGLQNCVIFTGFRRDLRRLYAALDIATVPSLSEPFGNVALEAMAAAKPVVASRVGGLVESVLDHKTGLLVPPGDSHALARAIGTLLDNPSLAQQMAKAGRERVHQYFTLERVVREVEEVYDRLAGRDAAPVALSPATP